MGRIWGLKRNSGRPLTSCVGRLDAAEYKHVVLGLIFLKYISDAFEERRAELTLLCNDPKATTSPTIPSSRRQLSKIATSTSPPNVFWVPEEARWSMFLQDNAKQPTIGTHH